MTGYDSGDLSGMVEKISSGATSALGEIEMAGYDSNDLSAMVEKVTSGTTGALGKIQMEGFSSDDISSLESTVSSSTTTALGKIKMTGFDPNNISDALKNSINTGLNTGKLKQPPILKEIAAVTSSTPKNLTYVFSSTKAGTISYEGSCKSSTTSVTSGNNTITFNTLSAGTYSNCKIKVTDSKGNISSPLTVSTFTIKEDSNVDTQLPNISVASIINVTAIQDNGTYKAGEVIDIQVVFSEKVYVLNNPEHNPRLFINTGGGGSAAATYQSGSATDTLVFKYTIGSSDLSTDLDYASTPDQFTEGDIIDKNGKKVMLDLPYPGTPGSLSANKDLIIGTDSVAPNNATISINNGESSTTETTVKLNISATDNSGHIGYYASEDNSTPSSSANGWMTIKPSSNYNGNPDFSLSSETKSGTYTKTVYLWFKDSKGNVSSVASDSINYIYTSNSIDDSDPKVVLVESKNSDGNYKIGDNLSITVAFDETVIVSGIPTLQLETGDIDQHAFYNLGNNTNKLTFNYTVQTNDNSSDLNYSSTNALSLNSGYIKDLAGNNADLTLYPLESSASLGGSKNILVDGIRPTVVSTNPADNSSSISLSDNITITFSEAMDIKTITTNTSNTSCSGSLQISLDNFSTCVQMSSSPSISNANKTFTVTPPSNLSISTTYKIRITTGVKDSASNALSSQWTISTGFTTTGTLQLGTSSDDDGYGVATDLSGNVYVVGTTTGGLDGNFDNGSFDIFLVKYNSSGTKQWTRQIGTSRIDFGFGVASDSSGHVYVTGYTEGRLDDNSNSGGYDIFLMKYNSSGEKKWSKLLGTSTYDIGASVTVDSSDNIYVTGYTYGGLDGKINNGSFDIFFVKYNSSGVKQWTQQLGTSEDDSGAGVTVDSSDNIYVTGYTKGSLDGYTNSGGSDIFLVKYYDNGTKQWTKQLGTSEYDSANGVTVDSSDNIYVTGSTNGGLDGNTHSGRHDIFLLKYNSSGIKK
jgi:hypothetical protein